MASAMLYSGKNSHAICQWAISEDLPPHELKGGFWIKQLVEGDTVTGYQLAAPARNGEIYLDPGDFLVREDDGGLVRLTPTQMKSEHPLLYAALTSPDKGQLTMDQCECGGSAKLEWREGGKFHRRATCDRCGKSTRWAVCGHGASPEEFWNDGVWDEK